MLSMEQVIKREQNLLKHLPLRLHKEVNRILDENYQKEIFRLTPDNKLRLLTLRTWMQRYKVSLTFILTSVAPYHLERIGKKKRKHPHSLGFTVPTLCGRKSESLLKAAIEEDFPNQEHLAIWQWERIQEILRQRQEAPDREVGDHKTLSGYVQAYIKRVQKRQKEFEREMNRDSNARRRYRNNPWTA